MPKQLPNLLSRNVMQILAVFAVLSGLASNASATWTGTAKILQLSPRATGAGGSPSFYYFHLSTSIGEPGCPGTVAAIVSDPAWMSDAAYKTMIATVITSFGMSSPAAIYTEGCVNGYPRVIGVDVSK